jgi:transposase-like protein
MAQHFLLSTKARTLSLAQVMRLSDDEAYSALKAIRFTVNNGEPFCPKCGCVAVYEFKCRRIFKCKGCGSQFSVTSGTIFASRKLEIRDILAAIAIFVNGAKGHSALQLSRDLDVQYRTAYVLSHKLREVLADEQEAAKLHGEIEIDGAYFGGYVKPANHIENRVDRRLAMNRTGKREVVIVMRERNGRTLPFVSKSEFAGLPTINASVEPGSTVYADDASSWDSLRGPYKTKRINHSECYSDGEACTNHAESFFSRMRRAEIGTHHKIAGPYLDGYAGEMAWREDNRRRSNGSQYHMVVSAALRHPVSRQWKGYWQRAAA